MTEGLQHVQARNSAWDAGDAFTAWRENLILEKWFAPVLDTPSYVSATGHRWTADHRADAAARAKDAKGRGFVSRAYPYPLYYWPGFRVWAGVGARRAARHRRTRRPRAVKRALVSWRDASDAAARTGIAEALARDR